MKKRVVLFFLVVLFLVPALYSPQNLYLSDDALARGLELQTDPFLPSADGDESTDSIPYFNETLADDVMFYPDTEYNSSSFSSFAVGYDGEVTYGEGDHESTWAVYADDSEILEYRDTVGPPYESYSELVFSVGSPLIYLEFDVNMLSTSTFASELEVYNFGGGTWVDIGDTPTGGLDWTNVTGVAIGPYLNTTYHLRIRVYTYSMVSTAQTSLDYCEIIVYPRLLSVGHFAESFADVSDITTSDTSITTDGDVATITENGAGSTGRAYASFASTDFFEYYYEFQISTMTATTANLEFWDGAAYNTLKTFTALGTYKGIISDTDAETMQRIGFLVGSEGGNIKPDYLRISKSNETGWQHDGSTTVGNDAVGGTGVSLTSDGDYLMLTSGGSGCWANIECDTTSTAAKIETSYYPFVEIAIHPDDVGNTLSLAMFYSSGSSDYVLLMNSVVTTKSVYQFNVLSTGYDIQFFRLYAYAGQSTRWNYIQAYSIANYTVTQNAVTTNDYLYVDSNMLFTEENANGWFCLRYDINPSVNTATFNVWNATGNSALSTYFRFRHYVGAWEFEGVGETRGDFPSGTLTFFEIYTYGLCTLSAITFIEDGTAPDADIIASPNPPDDDEQVTLSSIVFDDVEVYKVSYNAISYPAGFSDVDYSATEGQENYWSYSFSTLIAGDYCFKVIAGDGANNSTITEANREYATIRFTVREAEITVETYTLFGAGSDFTYMQYSGHISHDCTFIIEEWSDTWAINETHSGSVIAGDFNIAWDKIGVNDIDANYTITFTNGSLTKEITSSYQTAYKYLRIADIDCDNLESSDSWVTNITVNFYTNKAVDWYIYDVDDNDAVLGSGSSTEGTDTITWVQNTARGAHYFAVKWTDGVSSEWYNSSYWIYDKNIDELPGGGDLGVDDRKTIQMWATIAAIIGFVGIVCIGLVYFKLDDMKSIQLPHYETQPGNRRK